MVLTKRYVLWFYGFNEKLLFTGLTILGLENLVEVIGSDYLVYVFQSSRFSVSSLSIFILLGITMLQCELKNLVKRFQYLCAPMQVS